MVAVRIGWTVESGPERVGNERIWRGRLADGRRAVLAQLLPELAREEALRRRYVRDAEWVRELPAPPVAEVLEIGPEPDPRDPGADPPWRLRVEPDGELLESWLAARAPAPIDEAIDLAARLCDALAEVHRRGVVLRDAHPRRILIGERIWFTDVGLARADILSSRTASSLILEGSPYASPEHLRATKVDQRSDLYTVGAILWRALTGALPFGDGPALLMARGPVPRLSAAREGVPAELGDIVGRCLAARPEDRFDSARELAAALRGDGAPGKSLVLVTCQACGRRLRAGLRLCLHCGKAAVQFRAADPGTGYWLDLLRVKEAAATLGPLRELAFAVSRPPDRPLNFMTGDRRMYSKEEREMLIHLPARLWAELTDDSARELEARLSRIPGIKVKRRSARRARRIRRLAMAAIASTFALGVVAAFTSPVVASALFMVAALSTVVFWKRRKRAKAVPILSLRDSPAALPAGDALVARLWAAMKGDIQPDVAEQLTELALLVQRLADRRAELLGGTRAEMEAVTAPLEPLVAIVGREASGLAALDRELATLDEAVMVRALAASEARGEPRSARGSILAGLDRLRSLEDARTAHMRRLLDASSLLRRTIELGLRVVDEEAIQRAELETARTLLDA